MEKFQRGGGIIFNPKISEESSNHPDGPLDRTGPSDPPRPPFDPSTSLLLKSCEMSQDHNVAIDTQISRKPRGKLKKVHYAKSLTQISTSPETTGQLFAPMRLTN